MAVAILAAFALSPTSVLKDKELYDRLYSSGYHANLALSHARGIINYVKNSSNIHTVLDYGCSHGFAVQALWEMGKNASGFDISSVAASLAQRSRPPPRRCVDALGFCFASDTALLDAPGAHHAVDAVISSDVLEHVETDQVPIVVQRLAHVAKRKLVLKIALTTESNKQPLRSIAASQRPRALHATIRPITWWLGQFGVVGFVLERALSTDTVVLVRER